MQNRKEIQDIYTLTYGVMDRDADANPMFHTFIVLSKMDHEKKLMKVDKIWTFYGSPSTAQKGCFSRVKIKLGLDVDFTGNHGYLRTEEDRYLTKGKGLHGKMIELPQEKYQQAKDIFQKDFSDQNTAIEEIALFYSLSETNKFRNYKFEKHSRFIYETELRLAKNKNRDPRLHPFEFRAAIRSHGFTMNRSHTCKSHVLKLLKDILTPEQIAELTGHGLHLAIPRYSGDLGYLSFFSEGPMRVHTKASGQKVHYRENKDEGVTTYMIPPQNIDASEEVRAALQLPEEYRSLIDKMISQLQQLEQLFLDADFPNEYSILRKKLLKKIREHYEIFAKVEPNKSTSSITRSVMETETFINALYLTMIVGDRRELDQTIHREKFKTVMQEIRFGFAMEEKPVKFDFAETLAIGLTDEWKKEFCKIVDRPFLKPFTNSYFNRI